ncbi:protein mono-ADP-ribosyltransferase PARP14-like isoform X2 [Petromyzon marinus]|nr:protein mono-ADP-ribosyltransferase PARP14-like isoform X3 [Petromyzon marinus]
MKAYLEVKGLPAVPADDRVVMTKLQKYFQSKRLSGGGECEELALLPGGRARLRFKQEGVLERVLNVQKHVLEINQQQCELEVSRSDGEGLQESPLRVGGTTPTRVTGHDTGRPDGTPGQSPAKTVTSALPGASQRGKVEDPEGNPTIRVDKVDSLDSTTVAMYFENEQRSGGGEVTKVEEREQYWIITFADPAVAGRVLSRSKHTFAEKPLVCSEFVEKPRVEHVVQVLEPDPRRVLLRGFAQQTESSLLALYVETCSGTDDFCINYTDDDSCRVISFSSDTDTQAVIGRCGMKPLSGMSIKAEQLPLTSSVLLEDLPEGVSRDYLELYLESRSGPAVKVKEVDFRAGCSAAVVRLQSNEDVEKVLKSELRLKEMVVTAHRYYEAHGLALLSWDEGSFKAPEPQHLKVDPVLMEFITARPEQSQQLQEFINNHMATFKWPSGATKDVVKVSPAFAESQKANFILKSKWSKSIPNEFNIFFERYMHYSETIHANIFDELVAKLSTGQKDCVQIIPDKQQSKISIIGQKVDVEHVVKDLKKIKQLRRGEVNVKQTLVHLMPNFKKRLQNDFPEVDFHVNVKKRLITVEGPKDDSLAAESKILQMMLQCSEKPWLISEELRGFVLQLNRDAFIKNTFSQNGIDASISERGNDIMIVGASEDDLGKAEELLNMTFVEVKVKAMKGFDMKQNVKEWEEFEEELKASQECSDIETDAKFQMKCTSGSEVLITGYKDVIQRVAKQVEELMDMNAALEFFIAIKSKGVLQYLKTHGDMESMLPNGTKIDLDNDRNGFTIATQTKHKDGIIELIGDMSKNIKRQERTIQKPGCATFLHGRGKLFLGVLESTEKCIILLNQPRDPEDMEPQKNPKAHVVCETSLRGITVSVLKGHLQHHRVDVVVNAANGDLRHVGGLAKDLLKEGGQDLQDDSNRKVRLNGGPFLEGEAVMTGPGSLPCRAVIHAIGPRWDASRSHIKKALLKKAVEQSLLLAAQNNFTSIAMPAISSGIFGFPLPLCCSTIMSAVRDFCEDPTHHRTSLVSIQLINNDIVTVNEMQLAFENTFEQQDRAVAGSSLSQHGTYASHVTNSFENGRRRSSERQDRSVKEKARTSPPLRKEETSKLQTFKKTTQPPNPNEYHTQEGLQIHLVKGNLEEEEVDVIVNTVANDLDLSRGAVSAALLRKAGPLLQELTNDGSGGGSLRVGDVLKVKTKGCKLSCREIYHTVCCSWKEGGGTDKVLSQIVSTCLKMAQSSNYQSISFPAIGTGNLNFPKPITAKLMLDEFVAFSKQNPTTRLQNVRLMVYGKDDATFAAFHNELQKLRTAENERRGATGEDDAGGGSREEVKGSGREEEEEEEFEIIDERRGGARGGSDASPSFTKEPQGNYGFYSELKEEGLGTLQMKFGKVVVVVKQGNIVQERTDAIVNSTDENFSHGSGVSAAIMKAAGPRIQSICKKEGIYDGFAVTGSGDLSCKSIVHVVLNNSKEELSQVLFNALGHCDDLGMISISVPALGTGGGRLSPQDSASAILDAVAEFSVQKGPKKLRCVRVIIFEVDMLPDFYRELQGRLKKPGPQQRGFLSMMKRTFKSYFSVGSELQEQDNHTVQTNMGIKPVHIQVYSASDEINSKVLDEIDEKLTTEGCNKQISDEIIAEFGEEEQEAICLLKHQNQVLINFTAQDTISVEGNITDVSQVLIKLHEMMNDTRKRRDRAQQEEMLAKNVQWMFLRDEQYIAFSPKHNAMIEEASKKNQGVVSIAEEKHEGHVSVAEKVYKTKDGETLPIKRKKAEDIIPIEWMDVSDSGQDRVLSVPLDPTSHKYRSIANDFKQSLGKLSKQPSFQIEEITQIQNHSLWKLYMTKKKEMDKANKPNTQLNERILFHGTAYATCDKVNTNGFNRSYCGKNATCYGNGVYFAVSASYSAQPTYSPAESDGSKYMYRTRVLTGDFTTGKQGMIEPPPKGQQNAVLYDSVTDNMNNPSMFVIFNDNQAYPEHLIKFKL